MPAQVTDLACNVERGRARMHTEAFFFLSFYFFVLLQRHMAVIRNAHVVKLECTSPYFVCEQPYI